MAHLGQPGLVPGYPGIDVVPPQLMLTQIRGVLDVYAAAGGAYTETVVAGAGHWPQIKRLDEVDDAVRSHRGL